MDHMQMTKMVEQRGPRWAVTGALRPGEHTADYAHTGERAERLRKMFENRGCHAIRVYPPIGAVDLVQLGEARIGARIEFDRATAVLRAAVVQAHEDGRTKVEIARDAQIDRSTVNEWVTAAAIAAERAAGYGPGR